MGFKLHSSSSSKALVLQAHRRASIRQQTSTNNTTATFEHIRWLSPTHIVISPSSTPFPTPFPRFRTCRLWGTHRMNGQRDEVQLRLCLPFVVGTPQFAPNVGTNVDESSRPRQLGSHRIEEQRPSLQSLVWLSSCAYHIAVSVLIIRFAFTSSVSFLNVRMRSRYIYMEHGCG